MAPKFDWPTWQQFFFSIEEEYIKSISVHVLLWIDYFILSTKCSFLFDSRTIYNVWISRRTFVDICGLLFEFFISPMSTILLYFYGFFRMSGEKVENRFSINFLLNRLLRLKWPQLRNGFTFSKTPAFRETSLPATLSPLAKTGCLSTSSVTSTRFGRILLVTDEPGLALVKACYKSLLVNLPPGLSQFQPFLSKLSMLELQQASWFMSSWIIDISIDWLLMTDLYLSSHELGRALAR